MITCYGNVREGGDDRFYVSVRGSEGHINPFYISDSDNDPMGYATGAPEAAIERRDHVNQWIMDNCAEPASIFGNTSVVFENESDAILFWFTFRA